MQKSLFTESRRFLVQREMELKLGQWTTPLQIAALILKKHQILMDVETVKSMMEDLHDESIDNPFSVYSVDPRKLCYKCLAHHLTQS